MSDRLAQTRRFARSYKILHDNVAADVDAAAAVAEDPSMGELKKGGICRICMSTNSVARARLICWATPSMTTFVWTTSKPLAHRRVSIAISNVRSRIFGKGTWR